MTNVSGMNFTSAKKEENSDVHLKLTFIRWELRYLVWCVVCTPGIAGELRYPCGTASAWGTRCQSSTEYVPKASAWGRSIGLGQLRVGWRWSTGNWEKDKRMQELSVPLWTMEVGVIQRSMPWIHSLAVFWGFSSPPSFSSSLPPPLSPCQKYSESVLSIHGSTSSKQLYKAVRIRASAELPGIFIKRFLASPTCVVRHTPHTRTHAHTHKALKFQYLKTPSSRNYRVGVVSALK